MSNSQIIYSNCVFCDPDEKSETIIICQVCKDKIDSTKEYAKLNSSLKSCPICHKSTTSLYLKSHGLCTNCYRKKGGKPNSPPSPTAKEVMNHINSKITIYEKTELPKTYVLTDIINMYFEHMGKADRMSKKLTALNLAIDEYLVDLVKQCPEND
jgi:hypothetical protein